MIEPPSGGNWKWPLLPVIVFLGLRLPLVVHQPGGQDEQVFAVPGWTVAKEGVPRVPYLVTDKRATFYQNADRCLMALPPGLFYIQAPFFYLLSAGYPTARMPLLWGGCLAIGLCYFATRKFGGNWFAGLLAASLLAFSRPLMFTSILARPDLLCMLCGWGALLTLWAHSGKRSWKRIVSAGALCGLGGLFHPFALVFCIQCGVWVLGANGSLKDRLLRATLLTFSAVAVLMLWLPLIIKFPQEFQSQFFANVVDRAGPGLGSRLLNPIPSFRHHIGLIWEFFGSSQTAFFGGGAIISLVILLRQRASHARALTMIVVSSLYLTATVAGMHPTKGYWVYPTFWICVTIGLALQPWLTTSTHRIRYFPTAIVIAIGMVVFVPGGGLRSAWVYWNHWGDQRFHAGNFISEVLEEMPSDGLYLADTSYVFDIYLSGRETLLCQQRELFYGDSEIPYRYLLAAGEAVQDEWPKEYGAVLSSTIGTQATPQDCFVNIYVPSESVE
ncbi:glycosyltransferase family 39 protein [Thalassoglobus sp. JC818]|uniref:ArnT family glycosyltransferase n=1 Tax=Thalassoglobus sp. JC818 TaxID=3232136 RepID=UPI003458BA40